MKNLKLILFLILASCLNSLHGQQAPVAAGGNGSGSGGTVSYSIGQIDYTTNSSSSWSVAQGVQQPYEISSIGISELAIDLELSVYPNPTMDFLTLNFANAHLENSQYELIDINGNVLESNKINSNQTQICLDGLTPATYFLKITTETNELKVFKIIKL